MTQPEAIARALNARRSGRGWSARCPAHADRSPSLSIGSAPDGRLLLHCFVGCTFEDILEALRARGVIVGTSRSFGVRHTRGERRRGSQPDRQQDITRRIEFARRLWSAAVPAQGTLVETYLASRGVSLPPQGLRFAPTLRHPSGATAPAMTAAVRDVAGGLIGIHRTWLRRDGFGKADLDPAKAMLGSVKGGGVRLRSGDGVLIVAEGIETALSLGEAISGAAVIAALSATGVENLRLPTCAGELVIGADGDAAGRRAARELAMRAARAGWQVRTMIAPAGHDWNDVLLGRLITDADKEASHVEP